jgi:hypothetical protein
MQRKAEFQTDPLPFLGYSNCPSTAPAYRFHRPEQKGERESCFTNHVNRKQTLKKALTIY